MTMNKNHEQEIRRRLLRSFKQQELKEIVATDDSATQLVTRAEFVEHIVNNWKRFSEQTHKTINKNLYLASAVE